MPFRQGIDYGPRDGTLGLSFHMSEGGDGLVDFLARHTGEDLHEWALRVNGVSCNAALLSDGTIWQMLDRGHASGNLNPADRADEYGYYGGHHLRDVLGSHWPDPNTWTVSMEIAGFRAAGPTAAQVKTAIAWGRAMTLKFPTIRGATGHHDQSPKACPGLTANMKAIFAGVGGHGLWTAEPEEPMRRLWRGVNAMKGGTIALTNADHDYLDLGLNEVKPCGTAAAFGLTRRAFGPVTLIPSPPPAVDPKIGPVGYVFGDTEAFVQAADVTFTPDPVAKIGDTVVATVAGFVP
jgi:hypothetical protein